MTNAQYEQKIFWNIFEDRLKEKGNPFCICYEHIGTVRNFGCVNKYKARVALGLVIEFLYREEAVKINIYIENNVPLFNFLYIKKERIEEELGFKPQWIFSGKRNPNTRRVITTFPIKIGEEEDYCRVIDKLLPYVMKYKKVFEKYISDLCDF